MQEMREKIKAMIEFKIDTEELEQAARGERVKQVLKACPPPAEIARLCGGITVQAVNGWKSGKIKCVYMAILSKLSGADLYWLITGDDSYLKNNDARTGELLAMWQSSSEPTREAMMKLVRVFHDAQQEK